MKKIILGFFGLLIFSCSSNDFELGDMQEIKENGYKTNFIEAYGTPSPTHDWGFGSAMFGNKTLTRSHDVNGNLWYQDWVRPINVGVEVSNERELVLAEFSKKRENAVNTINVDWNNYWVQQVHQSNNSYKDGFGNSTGDIHTKMNKIIAYNEEGFNETIYPDWNNWQATQVTTHYEHVNNFNNGTNTTEYTDDVTKEKFIGTTLMKDMGETPNGTPKFGYHNTVDSKDHFEYIIIAGEEIDSRLSGYYYVGFDFCASHPQGQEANKNMDVERDWIFNDWIVRISPAEHVGNPIKTLVGYGRVICEDLGATANSDFDFNDVVFDAYIYSDGSCDIILQAAGGTLPLSVGGHEVHSEFGVDTKVMVNTGAGETKSPVTFTIPNGISSLSDIAIVVRDKNAIWTLNAEIGEPPAKICVGTDFRWCREFQHIEWAYPEFVNWVGDSNTPWQPNPVVEYIY